MTYNLDYVFYIDPPATLLAIDALRVVHFNNANKKMCVVHRTHNRETSLRLSV